MDIQRALRRGDIDRLKYGAFQEAEEAVEKEDVGASLSREARLSLEKKKGVRESEGAQSKNPKKDNKGRIVIPQARMQSWLAEKLRPK